MLNKFDLYDKYFEYIVKIQCAYVESLKILINDLLTNDFIYANILDSFV